MSNIYQFVSKSDNRRPLYTSYELSKMVRDKRFASGLTILEFATQYNINSDTLMEIELGMCSFSPKMYKICGKILNLTTEDLLAEIVDDEIIQCSIHNNIQDTFNKANMIFNEIIMQKKIGTN